MNIVSIEVQYLQAWVKLLQNKWICQSTERDWKIGRILTEGLKKCESEQQILAKLKKSGDGKH
jgi:hypothetical protein